MNWEIKRRLVGETLWAGKGAEGRKVYTRTLNRQPCDTPEEPTGNIYYYTIRQAMKPGN